ncbi:FKBP-type peptidyl-prolyl cis-trans isomerase [Oceanicoccus sagamiensis]|uniref:Peptidyl-prolyl cis-trans isomerase n=1 Tax=Oceanicoccus sagamiensis TaxID=716816 RepID=A0A1X9N3S4_9GAMM|nr:FKBP-type peptidyl-prolyl cis-trans isomerase [Oceanicoccus sagamiensis]ARN72830.1 peptidylprolyl isomerase [Oceanicoccus sagamiensis]
MSELSIGTDSQVTLHFSLKFDDGSVIDSTFDRQPATFVMGDGSLLDGFEKKIHGMKKGEEGSFTVLPEEGFGQPNPSNVQQFSRGDFSADLELAEGLVISFADASQSELPGVVKSIDGDNITVDFNHPLAGRNIQFDVAIVDVAAKPAD